MQKKVRKSNGFTQDNSVVQMPSLAQSHSHADVSHLQGTEVDHINEFKPANGDRPPRTESGSTNTPFEHRESADTHKGFSSNNDNPSEDVVADEMARYEQ